MQKESPWAYVAAIVLGASVLGIMCWLVWVSQYGPPP
jgi:hypothetical protein